MPALDGMVQRYFDIQALMRTMHLDMYHDADSHVEAESDTDMDSDRGAETDDRGDRERLTKVRAGRRGAQPRRQVT